MIHQQQQKVEHFLEKTDDNIKRKRHHQDGERLHGERQLPQRHHRRLSLEAAVSVAAGAAVETDAGLPNHAAMRAADESRPAHIKML